MSREIKIIFAPGSLDGFDGTQDELDELIESIKDAFQSGEIFDDAMDMDDEDDIWEILNQKTPPRQ